MVEDVKDIKQDTKLESRGLFGTKKRLIVRFFKGDICVGTRRVRYGESQVTFKKRMFALNYETKYMNQKGLPEINHDFDNGALSMKLNAYRDPYINKADSSIIRDLYKKGTVKAIWGIDQLPFILLIILTGAVLVAMVFAFYVFGQLQATQTENTGLKQFMTDLNITIPPELQKQGAQPPLLPPLEESRR